MKQLVKQVKGLNIYFEELEEFLTLEELLPNHTKEELQAIYNTCKIFASKVTVEIEGIELSSSYLGGCIYKDTDEFISKSNGYFSGMVKEALEEAKKKVPALIKKLESININL